MRQQNAQSVDRQGVRAVVKKTVAIILAALLAAPWSMSQNGAPPEQGTETSPPQRLRIQVLNSTPLAEPAGALSALVLRVRVLDQLEMPVPRATVSFRLPEAGPGGAFLNGLSSEIAIADERGEAAVQGFDWREEAGVTFVHVIAAYGAVRAGAMVEVHLARKAASPQPASRIPEPPPARQPVEIGRMATPVSGTEASEEAREVVRQPLRREVPREMAANVETSDATPMVRNLDPSREQRTDADPDAHGAGSSYVTVKRKSGGSNKVLWILLVAGAAAGGALAAGMGGGAAAASSPGSGGASGPPAITIGNPTITISGGN